MESRRSLLRKAHRELRAASAARRLGWRVVWVERMRKVADLRRTAQQYPKRERAA
jgi:hypothetical protein